jgi:hypothetical protein
MRPGGQGGELRETRETKGRGMRQVGLGCPHGNSISATESPCCCPCHAPQPCQFAREGSTQPGGQGRKGTKRGRAVGMGYRPTASPAGISQTRDVNEVNC